MILCELPMLRFAFMNPCVYDWVWVYRGKTFRLSLVMYVHDALIFYNTSLHLQLPALLPAFYWFLTVCPKTSEERSLVHHLTQQYFVLMSPCGHKARFLIPEKSPRLISSYFHKEQMRR